MTRNLIFSQLNILDPMIKRRPTGFLCMFAMQYIFGRVVSFSVKGKPENLEYSTLFYMCECSFFYLLVLRFHQHNELHNQYKLKGKCNFEVYSLFH